MSIVVPVFNVEQYIGKCLDSLLVPEEQLKLLDIVVVNDGTPDKSAEIAKEYQVRYPEAFRVIDKKNGGHGSAWNRGIKEAKGKFLFFLDSDDWFDTQQFSVLISSLGQCETDLVFLNRTNYFASRNQEKIFRIKNLEPDRIYSSDEFDWINNGNGPCLTYCSTTVYRTAILQEYYPVFCEGVMYDDIILQVLPIMASKSFVYKDLNVYHYRIGRPGQSHDPKVMAKRSDDFTIVLKSVLEFIKNHRADLPEGSMRRVWADYHYSQFCTYHYEELSRFSYRNAKPRLADWDSFVRESYPDIQLTPLVKAYRSLPFAVYYPFYKASALTKKGLRRVLRMR